MQTIGAFAAKTHFSALLEKVERGDQIVITKHGHPVAKLIPATGGGDKISIRAAIERIKKFGETHSLGNLDWKALRDEGRR